jgi:hypothetical protein
MIALLLLLGMGYLVIREYEHGSPDTQTSPPALPPPAPSAPSPWAWREPGGISGRGSPGIPRRAPVDAATQLVTTFQQIGADVGSEALKRAQDVSTSGCADCGSLTTGVTAVESPRQRKVNQLRAIRRRTWESGRA